MRAMEIIEILAAAESALGLTEVARRAGVPKTTAARLLNELVDIGVAARSGIHYGPGLRLQRLTEHTQRRGKARLRRAVIPDLVRLHDETGLDVAFATLRHGRVQFETILYGPERADILGALPLSTPAHCTSSGKILLAHTPLANVDHPLVAFTDRTITDPAVLARELEQARREGVAASTGEYVAGIGSLAVPVFGTGTRLIGALVVCGGPDVVDAGRAREALRRAGHAAGGAVRDPHRSR
jgi:DNA-binding IclR family transcriptional regulator